MTHAPALTAIAASVALILLAFAILQLLLPLWPRAVAARIGQIAKAMQQWHPRSPAEGGR